MPPKTAQLQIRVTARQKTALKRAAAALGLDVSNYVLSRVLPAEPDRFAAILRALARADDHRFALAELNDFLSACPASALGNAVSRADLGTLSSFLRNYVAAMVEQAVHMKDVAPPAWTRDVAPLDTPYFATPLKSLRMHLLRSSPVPFKRRNLFVNASIGGRV